MTPPLHSFAVGRLMERVGPPADEVQAEMRTRAERESFPTVGPEVGRTLALLVRLTGARSVLELGSGFGYSAYWMARALPPDGSVVLTEHDRSLLDDAREYFERGGLLDCATFRRGDALDIAAASDEQFDLVVLDHDTTEYARGLDVATDRIAPGGVVVADNVAITEPAMYPEELARALDGGGAGSERTDALVAFFETLDADGAFETYLLPVGEGLAVATRLE